MRQATSTTGFNIGRALRKLSLSLFVIFTFLIYAVHERLAGQGPALAGGLAAAPKATPTESVSNAAQEGPTAVPSVANANPTSAAPQPQPSPTPAVQPPTAVPASPTAAGQYKDGQYTGPQVDAFYGWVQVQAVVQHGQIADVKFLQYPNDRRTSVRINNIAMPYLTTEAIQAQSANVDIISGATLTSQAFAESLQAALDTAKP